MLHYLPVFLLRMIYSFTQNLIVLTFEKVIKLIKTSESNQKSSNSCFSCDFQQLRASYEGKWEWVSEDMPIWFFGEEINSDL